MASHTKELAKMLGLELGEEFLIKDNNNPYIRSYRITEKELECFNEIFDEWGPVHDSMYKTLLCGEDNVIKTSWKPDDEEGYYVPLIDCMGRPGIAKKCWGQGDKEEDMGRYNAGLVCKTPEEALKLAEIMLDAVKEYREEANE